MSREKPQYTNSYLVGVSLDDDFVFPALMFTNDPTFKPQGRRAREVQQWCDEWGIDRSRIFFKPSKKTYCKESMDQVAQFKRLYASKLRNARILHDAGNSFKKDGVEILEELANRVVVFPPVTHGELSVLDNKLFAVAKNQWRSERPPNDYSKQDLYLLWCIDWAEKESIRKYWVHNFLLDVENVTLEACRERLKGSKGAANELIKKEERYIESFIAYRDDIRQAVSESEVAAMQSNLDGRYWE